MKYYKSVQETDFFKMAHFTTVDCSKSISIEKYKAKLQNCLANRFNKNA